ncbi:LytR/AlgR family response regulator transcription factor [Dolosigranulum pigrum]|uniref:LytR/AlgR family response regulator transcription factor n=1 Tax=Dolosigranulum pigrum TaxID=29394 RepID=UPI001AD85DA4|nr:LytTR family DNA-binding domain-containing protein [Dolosigranulum pigrum]QTJ33929.1 response regulator transcription factor [Dolosigranulum pigrum]QTJ39105.1 response regulator transcription factor [Dolosigranulum pigrum]QTJ47594.1 response regulator transcription factor [Dolosigranulum pigrum]
MYPLIICEDSPEQLDMIQTLFQHYRTFRENYFKLVLATHSPHDVLTYLDDHSPQKGVYLLDVHLQTTIDGLDLAVAIRQCDVQAKIIFITTDENAAPLTFKRNLEALSYINKPLTIDELRSQLFETLDIAYNRLNETLKTDKRLFSFAINSETTHIDINHILYLQTSVDNSHKLVLTTLDSEYEFPGKLATFEKMHPQLLRISKSALINPNNVVTIDHKTRDIFFNNTHSIQYAVRRKKEIKKRLL